MQKLLIADCNEEFRLALAEALQEHFHILSCGCGKKALALLRREAPDILVLDLMLPELDGISLMENMVSQSIHPKVLVVTSLVTDYVFESAQRFGIQYVMRKPCDISAAAARILDLGRANTTYPDKKDPRKRITQLLLSLGISSKHNGYDYMTEGLLLLIRDPDLSVTKALYPAIAKIFGCQPRHVERSIRSALEAAWKRGDPERWQTYFPGSVIRPSNAVFLTRMTDVLRREME